MNLWQQIWSSIFAWAVLVPAVAGIASVCWISSQATKQRWLPQPRSHLVPWTAMEVFLVFALSLLLPAAVYGVWESAAGAATKASDPLRTYISFLIAAPLFLVLSCLILHFGNGAGLYQIGIHANRWRQNIVWGCAAWFFGSLVVYGFHFLANWIMFSLGQQPEPHALTKLVSQDNPILEWTVLIFAAVVAAPLLEEFLFRGVIQRWTLKSIWAAHALLAIAVVSTLMQNQDHPRQSGVFVALVLLVYLICPFVVRCRMPAAELSSAPSNQYGGAQNKSEFSQFEEWSQLQAILLRRCTYLRLIDTAPAVESFRAICATALLFAGAHKWPTPIPLFVLGLMLGWMAWRTRSLIGPIVLHCLFNAVACIELARSVG